MLGSLNREGEGDVYEEYVGLLCHWKRIIRFKETLGNINNKNGNCYLMQEFLKLQDYL